MCRHHNVCRDSVGDALLAATPGFATPTHRTSASGHARSGHKSPVSYRAKTKGHRLHGQQGIDSARATQIQKALIREHYMTGEPNGNWDATTQAAMQKKLDDLAGSRSSSAPG